MMKKNGLFVLALLTILVASCKDSNEVRNAKGGYSFKTTGSATISESKVDDQLINLPIETGSFELVTRNDGSNVLLTFNQESGDVYYTDGSLTGDDLSFKSFDRTLTIPFEETVYDTLHIGSGLFVHDSIVSYTHTIKEIYDISVDGSAKVYENNIIFTLRYRGNSRSTSRKIEAENVSVLCKKYK